MRHGHARDTRQAGILLPLVDYAVIYQFRQIRNITQILNTQMSALNLEPAVLAGREYPRLVFVNTMVRYC